MTSQNASKTQKKTKHKPLSFNRMCKNKGIATLPTCKIYPQFLWFFNSLPGQNLSVFPDTHWYNDFPFIQNRKTKIYLFAWAMRLQKITLFIISGKKSGSFEPLWSLWEQFRTEEYDWCESKHQWLWKHSCNRQKLMKRKKWKASEQNSLQYLFQGGNSLKWFFMTLSLTIN